MEKISIAVTFSLFGGLFLMTFNTKNDTASPKGNFLIGFLLTFFITLIFLNI